MSLRIRLLTILMIPAVLSAQVPNLINYQGRVAVGNINFDGAGLFKFALVNATGTATFWSNDGASVAGSEPVTTVSLPVSKGLYSVLLGNTAISGMSAIPSDVWSNPDVRLRVWFNDGVDGSQLLTPDMRISPNGYLPDGIVTSSKLASNLTLTGTVTAERMVSSVAEPAENVYPANGMVWIKPGVFLMGSRGDELGRAANESPRVFVTISKGFWIGSHEVTQAEYQTVMGSNPSGFTGDTNLPVEQVTWSDAVSYCTTLTASERSLNRLPAGWGYRLPTEAEWEYCCRAGARTTRYAYGDDRGLSALTNYAWYSTNSSSATHPVEQKLGNPWGLMDMHGNVWEWCQDWYGGYPGGSATDPQGPLTGTNRVIRGGSYDLPSSSIRSANRSILAPSASNNATGFRVVLSSGQP